MCHQTVSLIARHLEEHGIATVIMGCAIDIVEHCGVPRFVFSDFPLGNSAGKPNDVASQRQTLAMALDLFEQARAPRTTVRSPQQWHEGAAGEHAAWKRDFTNIEMMNDEEIRRRRSEFESQKGIARKIRTE